MVNDNNVEELFYGDMRLDALMEDILDVIYDRAIQQKLPIPAVLGVLELVKQEIIEDQKDGYASE